MKFNIVFYNDLFYSLKICYVYTTAIKCKPKIRTFF